MDRYPSKEEIKELKERKDIVLGSNFKSGLDKVANNYLMPIFKNIHLKETTSFLSLSALYSIKKEEAVILLDDLHTFCWNYSVSIMGAAYFLIGFDCAEINRIKRKKISLRTHVDKVYYNAIHDLNQKDAMVSIYLKMSEVYKSIDRDHDISNYPKTFQQILINSFDEIRDNVIKEIQNFILPLDQINLKTEKIIEEIEHMKDISSDIFLNSHALAQINQDRHFLSYLKKDNIEITDDYKLIFSGHTLGLSMGYTDKAILLSLDKKSTIRELESNLKNLLKYKNIMDNIDEAIVFTEELINFIEQNKAHANYLPYKALAKHMGLSKNKVKRYAKQFAGINEGSFLKNFDALKTYTNKLS